jgi:hypothetical protein
MQHNIELANLLVAAKHEVIHGCEGSSEYAEVC